MTEYFQPNLEGLNKLKFLNWNAQGLINKVDELKMVCEEHKIDIIGICEH